MFEPLFSFSKSETQGERGQISQNSVHVVYGWPLNEIEAVCELKYKFIQIVYNKRSTVVYTRGNYKIILTLSGLITHFSLCR